MNVATLMQATITTPKPLTLPTFILKANWLG